VLTFDSPTLEHYGPRIKTSSDGNTSQLPRFLIQLTYQFVTLVKTSVRFVKKQWVVEHGAKIEAPKGRRGAMPPPYKII